MYKVCSLSKDLEMIKRVNVYRVDNFDSELGDDHKVTV